MQIVFHKISGGRHALEIHRDRGAAERVECETRSFLTHDLLHYAVECEAQQNNGFWGQLAQGKSIAAMSADAAMEFATEDSELVEIERVVGPLTGLAKGVQPLDILAGLNAQALPYPAWLTEAFVERVAERFRQLIGRWKKTPFGGTMTLAWPLDRAP